MDVGKNLTFMAQQLPQGFENPKIDRCHVTKYYYISKFLKNRFVFSYIEQSRLMCAKNGHDKKSVSIIIKV